jgi:hypothetical protein
MKHAEIHIAFIISLFIMINACDTKTTTGGGDPGSVIEDYFKLIIEENFENAAKMYRIGERELTEDECKKVRDMIEWAVDQYEIKGGIKEVIVVEETKIGDNKTAFVKYNIVFNNGDESDLKQSMIKAEGKWYLQIAPLLK